jgi:hypothetical protein
MYVKVHNPEHPLADATGFVSVHRLVAEAILGRPLEKGEVVHHKDFVKWHNHPDNLWIMTRLQHQRLPELYAKFIHEKGLHKEFEAYYENNWDAEDLQIETERELVRLQNQRRRLRARIKKYKNKQLQKGEVDV